MDLTVLGVCVCVEGGGGRGQTGAQLKLVTYLE